MNFGNSFHAPMLNTQERMLSILDHIAEKHLMYVKVKQKKIKL
jgi:hypothetical protein